MITFHPPPPHNRNIAIKSMGAIFTLAAFPPTSAAARHHSLLTYLQVQQWLGRDLPPTEWGWKYLCTDFGCAKSQIWHILDMFISHGYIPTISLPTRITHSSTTLIDNIYVKCDNLVSGIISVDISDHLPVFTFIERATQINSKPVKITCRPINDVNLAKMKSHLDTVDWTILLNMNPNEANNHFNKVLTDSLNSHIPEKTITLPFEDILRLPWMTPALLKSTKTKYKMYRKSLGKPKSSSSYINFIKYRNTYNKIKRLSKETYFTNELAIHRNDLTKTWKILKSLIGKLNDKSGISDSFKINGSLC